MARTDDNLLEKLIRTLNEMNGLPTEPHDSEAEAYTPNPLCLHLSSCNGHVALEQMARDGHGTRAVSNGMAKRELEIFLRGMIAQQYVANEVEDLCSRNERPCERRRKSDDNTCRHYPA